MNRATARIATADDLPYVSRLMRDGEHRYYGFAGSDLPALLASQQGFVLDAEGQLWGALIASWPAETTTWLRGLALAERLDLNQALALLLPLVHAELRARGLHNIFYAGDETADAWLLPALQSQGYQPITEVLVYEKRTITIPDYGNQAVRIRPATTIDLATVLDLDRACFEAQWTKDDTVFGPAIGQGPFFVIAELDDEPVGYAYATVHFGGRLMHLVRIAVDPRCQGRGIGVRLLAEVTLFAREHNADVITLNTQLYNEHAQQLYRWFGFKTTGERQTILRYALQ